MSKTLERLKRLEEQHDLEREIRYQKGRIDELVDQIGAITKLLGIDFSKIKLTAFYSRTEK